MNARPVVVVGGAGFIGRALCARLAARGEAVVTVLRRPAASAPGVATRVMGTLDADSDWGPVLDGARAVVHLASRAHAPLAPGEGEGWIEAEAARARHLAAEAARAGIERLVLLSSIKVHGEATGERPFDAAMPPAPGDPYGVAKWRVEQAMRTAAAGGPGLVVLRPPLVYGPGVKANFRALLRLADRAVPLPLASIDNRRALVFLENLLDLVDAALTHPAAPGRTFLLRDDDEVSTPELVRRIARQLDRPARLLPCPPGLLHGAARLLGRGAAADRLLGSLQVDDGATRATLGWRPRYSLDQGLAATCRWYRAGPEQDAVSSGPGSPL